MQRLGCFSRDGEETGIGGVAQIPTETPQRVSSTKRAAEGSSSRHAKQARTSDPRSMAPHSLNLETFQLRFPFIKVRPRMRYMGEFKDRCAPDFLMKAETMGAFVEFLGGPALLRALSAFETTGGERSTAPVHFTLFSAINALARALTEIRHGDDVEVEGLHWEVTEDPCSSQGGEEDVSVESSRSLLSHEDAFFQAEAAYTTLSGGTDIVAKAYDTAFMRKSSLQPGDISALVTLLVLELNSDGKLREVWSRGPGGAFQAGDCAVHHAFQNLKVGRKSPIWLITQSRSLWSYGALIADGIVDVSADGQVLSEDPGDQVQLQARTEELRDYMMDEDCFYPPGRYMKGKLYISDEVMHAPDEATLVIDSWRYFESILRICLGESVLAWAKADVDKLVAEVRRLEQLESEYLLAGISDSQLAAWRSLTKRMKSRRRGKGV